jgi:diguanylate cyclase (GGDEF)-like protein
MNKVSIFFRDKSLRRKFPDKVNLWNSSVLDSLTTFSILVSGIFIIYCIFATESTEIKTLSFISIIFFILYKNASKNYIKDHTDKSTPATFVFWGMFILYISILNVFVFKIIPGYFFGMGLIFLGLVVQASFFTVALISTICTLTFIVLTFLYPPATLEMDIIVIITSYLLTLFGSHMVSGTRTVELEDLTKLEKLSSIDPLTRIFNRRSTQFLIENKIIAGNVGFFLVIDIDNFKGINDNNGHLAGDTYLQELSSVLKESAAKDCVVGRVGGDEFIVYLTNYTYKATVSYVSKVQEKMQSVLSNIDSDMGTISMGIVKSRKKDDYNTLFARADLALYEVKSSGKNNYSFYESSNELLGKNSSETPKLLIVDDTFITRKLLQNYFEDEFAILQAENGEQAMNLLLHNNNVSVILLDMNMPIMNGFEFLRKYKHHNAIADIPVVVITADPTLEAEALRNGAIDMIVKPFDVNVVKLRVHNALNYSK